MLSKLQQDAASTPTIRRSLSGDRDQQSTPEPSAVRAPSKLATSTLPPPLSARALTPGGLTSATEDSDTDFQSAYSAASRRGSSYSLQDEDGELNKLPDEFDTHRAGRWPRERISSTATVLSGAQH